MAGPPPPGERRALLDVDDIDDSLLDQVVGGLSSFGLPAGSGADALDDWAKPVAAEAWRAPAPAAAVSAPSDPQPSPGFLVGGGLSLSPSAPGTGLGPPRWRGVGSASPADTDPGGGAPRLGASGPERR